jgi:TRAP-type C4-dicarboxylate transport system permease small subunit
MSEPDEPPWPVSRITDWYGRIMTGLAGSSMAVITLIMIAQVIARYGFNASLIWAEELCRYILMAMTFLFVGLAFQRGEFVSVDIVPMLLRPGWRFALRVASMIPVLVFLGLMTVYGYSYASRFTAQNIPAVDFIWMSITGGSSANISVKWLYHTVTIGSAFLFLHVLGSLIAEGWALLHPRRATRSRSTD